MESIKEAAKAVVAFVLKENSFTSVESGAMEVLATFLLNYSIYMGSRLKHQAEMSRRTSPTLVDAAIILQEISAQADEKSTYQDEKSQRARCGTYRGISLCDLLAACIGPNRACSIKVETEEEPPKPGLNAISEACSYVECPQNYYDFFPKFPPAHTFKSSLVKRKIVDNRAQKARLRNEQTKKIVENLFSIMMKSGKSPRYANYLL